MNIDEINEMWAEDCLIDDDRLDKETIRTPSLHSKYLKLYTASCMRNGGLNAELSILKQKKIRYYRGEMSKEELQEEGWNQYQGIKPLKNEIENVLDGDIDITKIKAKIEYTKIMATTLESILKQITSRDWQIKNIISWKTFIAGG